MTNLDLLIVGAGPVGLVSAALLGNQGFQCRIIDKLDTSKPLCKALSISPRTLEIFESLGLLHEILDEGLKIKGQRTFVDGVEKPQILLELSNIDYDFISIPQHRVENILLNYLNKHNIILERNIALHSFWENDQGIEVTLVNQETHLSETITTQYMLGCDGAHSTVRSVLGINFSGDQLEDRFMLGDVHVAWDFPHNCVYRFQKTTNQKREFLLFVPYKGENRFRISTIAPSSLANSKTPTLSQLQNIVDNFVPNKVIISDLRWSSFYKISHRIVDHYQVGKIFLAGDAAHIHPPIGGQGMNTGIQDAFNLAWKLALVINKQASPQLLESYHHERHPVGLDVVTRTTLLAKTTDSEEIKDITTQRLLKDSQLFIHYPQSEWIKEETASDASHEQSMTIGETLQDVHSLSREGIHFNCSLFDLTRDYHFKLLIYIADPEFNFTSPDLVKLHEWIEKENNKKLSTYIIIKNYPNVFIEFEHFSFIIDSKGIFQKKYAQNNNTIAYIIRPDNYIAYKLSPFKGSKIITFFKKMG